MSEPEKYRETRRLYRESHREERNEYARQHYPEVKEKRIEQVKQWRNNNKDKLIIKIECPCGGKFQKKNKWDHEQTMKHKRWTEQQTE